MENCTIPEEMFEDSVDDLRDGEKISTGSESLCLGNTSVTFQNETRLFDFYRMEQLTFLGSLFFMIVIGNSAVLAALILTKTPRKSRMNFFIMHLALADLGVGLVNVLTDFLWKVTVTWYAGNFGCKIVKYFQTVVLYSSNYVLVALSIDRYDAITHPLKFSGSWRRARMLIAAAWFLSLTFAIPQFLIFHVENLPHDGTKIPQCWANLKPLEWQIYLTIVFTILFLIPAIIIAACYTIMVHTIWTQSRILTPQGKTSSPSTSTSNGILRKSTCRNPKRDGVLCPPDDPDSRRASSRGLIPKAKIKSVKMTFVIVFVFILCSSPYFVFSLLQSYNVIPVKQSYVAVSTFFQSLSPLNSAANPIIYCLFSTHICRNLRKIKFINWLALKFCPRLGKSVPSASTGNHRRKYGPSSRCHHGDISGKGKSDYTTSMTTDSITRSAKSTGTTRFSSTAAGRTRQLDSTCFMNNREVHFKTSLTGNGGNGSNHFIPNGQSRRLS